MKKLAYLFVMLFITSCGGGGGDDGGGSPPPPPPPTPPSAANLTAPANNKVCETGTSISDSQSNVSFSWAASANTSTYDLKITNLNTNQITNKTGLTSTNTSVALSKGAPYSWQITSKNTQTTQTASSSTWKFYLAGETGETSYAPFPADLKSPSSGSTVERDSDGKVKLTWEGADPDTSSGLKYTLYLDKTDGKQDPSDDHKDLNTSELSAAVDADSIYYWRVKTTDGTNVSYSIVYSFRTE
jgi:hypothetical protein